MKLAAIKRLFTAGQQVAVTNHFITRAEHPCFGRKLRTVTRVTGSHLHFDVGGATPWPKAANVTYANGVVTFLGYPHAGDTFLTIELFPNVVAIAEVKPDFTVQNHGSLFILYAHSNDATQWVADHIPDDAMLWGPNGIVVEHRYISDIVDGIQNDGLEVE